MIRINNMADQRSVWSDDLFERNLPHIRDMIFLRLDSDAIEKCKRVCQNWGRYLNSKSFNMSWKSIHKWYVRQPWTAQNYEYCKCSVRYAAIYTCCDCTSAKICESGSSLTLTKVSSKRARYSVVQSSASFCCKFCRHCKMGVCGHQGSHMQMVTNRTKGR